MRSGNGSRCSSTAASAAAPTCSRRLALGARATLAGRAVLYGLAVDGEAGATSVLELLRRELELGLKLLGCTSPAEVTGAHVRRADL